MRKAILMAGLVLLLAIAGCGGPEPTAPAPTNTPLPTATSAPLPSPMPSPTATPPPPTDTAAPKPTASQTPPPTPTAMPTATVASGPTLIGEVTLRELPGFGHSPNALAFVDGRLYVANTGSANVSVIEGDRVTQVLSVGASPVALAVDPATGEIYVANEGENSVTVLSGKKVSRAFRAPERPRSLAFVSGQIVIGTDRSNQVSVVSREAGKAVRELALGDAHSILSMAFDPKAGLLFANVYEETYAIRVEDWRPLYKVTLHSYLTLCASPHTGRFYVNHYDDQERRQYLVAVRSADGLVLSRVPIGGDPRGAAVNARTGRIYVANSWTNDLTVIQEEPYRVLTTVPVGLRPAAVAVDEEHNRIYVANADSDNIIVLDGENHRLLAAIPLAITPQDVAIDPRTGNAYVANPSTNSIFLLEGGRLRREIPVGLHPVALALDPDTETLYVANRAEGTASIVDTKSGQVVQTVPVGDQPKAVAVNPATGRVYVGDAALDRRTREIVGQLALPVTAMGYPVKPEAIQVDPAANRLYVVAFNGIPGSNGGNMIYVLDGQTHERIEARPGTITTFDLALNPERGRLYSAAGRFGYFAVYAHDLISYEEVARREFSQWTRALAYNQRTGHLFLGLAEGSRGDVDQGREIRVLEGESLQDVASLPMRGMPVAIAVDAETGRAYICDAARGTVLIAQDGIAPGG